MSAARPTGSADRHRINAWQGDLAVNRPKTTKGQTYSLPSRPARPRVPACNVIVKIGQAPLGERDGWRGPGRKTRGVEPHTGGPDRCLLRGELTSCRLPRRTAGSGAQASSDARPVTVGAPPWRTSGLGYPAPGCDTRLARARRRRKNARLSFEGRGSL